jgi:glycosyltransferase involved in cell wall biosynthesis
MSRPIDSLQIGMHWFGERQGGLDRMFMEIVGVLPSQGVNVRGLVAGSPAVEQASDGMVHSFAPPQSPLRTRLRGVRSLARRLKHAQMPDVVATHFALYAAPTAGLFRGVPHVVHFHGPWADESFPETKRPFNYAVRHSLERYVYRSGTRHIVLSHAFGRILSEKYGVSEDRIRVVPGCVDVDRFDTGITRQEARERLGLPQDRPLLFCLRRLVWRMGLENLIDAMFVVKRELPDVLLTIAGRGPLEATLRAHVAARGLENHVHLAGFVQDDMLPLWYAAADLSIVPTVALEGFGLTTIESLASGTPVLVTPVGGLPEAVAPLSPELVLPAGGFHAIGAGIVEALRDPGRLPDAHACRAYARENFDRPVVAAKVAQVYREAIDAF